VPQFRAIRLAITQEAHRISIDKFHVFEIQNNSLDFFHFSLQLLHMLKLHSATQPQNNVFPVSASIDLQHHLGESPPQPMNRQCKGNANCNQLKMQGGPRFRMVRSDNCRIPADTETCVAQVGRCLTQVALAGPVTYNFMNSLPIRGS